MDEEIVKDDVPADEPDAVIDDTTAVLDAGNFIGTVSGGNADPYVNSTESGFDEADNMADSSTDICAYTVAEQEADALLFGGIDKLNGTCTLILFFLLFAWADKKIQAILNGVSEK